MASKGCLLRESSWSPQQWGTSIYPEVTGPGSRGRRGKLSLCKCACGTALLGGQRPRQPVSSNNNLIIGHLTKNERNQCLFQIWAFSVPGCRLSWSRGLSSVCLSRHGWADPYERPHALLGNLIILPSFSSCIDLDDLLRWASAHVFIHSPVPPQAFIAGSLYARGYILGIERWIGHLFSIWQISLWRKLI